MPLPPGTRLGPYEIVAPIGAGGMGEVYRARDTRLHRDVAIKTTNAAFAERFAREADAIAALNHPHICAIYDVGPDYIVMELLDGKPLTGPLSISDALRYASETAAALEHAHAKGVVHRDLKPANILRTTRGVKLVDFGLATVRKAVASAADATATLSITAQGTLLGTIHYMSPEQLEGGQADERSDVFSFGCVLYEWITGVRPFDGASPAAVIAAILERKPAPFEPAAVFRVVETALARNPEERWQSIREMRHALNWAAEQPSGREAHTASPARVRLPWIVAGTALAAAAFLAWALARRGEPGPAVARFAIEAPAGTVFHFLITSNSISPDGRYVVFRAGSPGAPPQLWLRPLDTLTARALPETVGGDFPFWSPDSRTIAFFAGDKLKRIDLAGGASSVICDVSGGVAAVGAGGTWNREGTIVFGDRRGLLRVSASGGTPVLLLGAGDNARLEGSYGYPQFLDDGRRFLYFNAGADGKTQGIYAASLDNPQRSSWITASPSKPAYVAPLGRRPAMLLYLKQRTLVAQRLDAGSLKLEGEAVRVADDIAVLASLYGAAFWASDAGVLAYRSGIGVDKATLGWISRDGRRLAAAAPEDSYTLVRISPDGARAVFGKRGTVGSADVWSLDFSRGVITRLTFDPLVDTCPVWSPDGRQIAFASDRTGTRQVYRKDGSGSGAEEQLTEGPEPKCSLDWSSDGRYILYSAMAAKTFDIWALPLAGGKPVAIVQSEFGQVDAQFSPDGKWIAYTSAESGRNEIYLRRFAPDSAPAGARRQVSTEGGRAPRWRRDGRELFYLSLDDRNMMAADVRLSSESAETGTPKPLFPLAAPGDYGDNPYPYDVTPDGQKFLVEETTGVRSASLTVVMNWDAALR